jgi:hypothetical protein
VRFEVETEERVAVESCNCSICRKTGYLHLIVPAARFRLISGSDQLTEYRFNTGVARHLFCVRCGIKSFYTPRSNPDGVSVNLRCLDDADAPQAEIREFDGRNWEAHAGRLAGLTKE